MKLAFHYPNQYVVIFHSYVLYVNNKITISIKTIEVLLTLLFVSFHASFRMVISGAYVITLACPPVLLHQTQLT